MLKLKMLISTVMALGIGGATLTACGPTPEAVAGAGSDTTFWIMSGSDVTQGTPPAHPSGGVSDHYNASQTAVKTYEIPPVLTAPFPGPSFTVTHDTHCTSDTVYNGSNPPPNGSSAGISALVNDTNGCIDFARSSRAAKAGDPASLSFWAFALDAVTWVKFPENTHAPSTLTPTQLTNIYTCNPSTHAPFVTNWNQVGGTSGAIKKYAPQTMVGHVRVRELEVARWCDDRPELRRRARFHLPRGARRHGGLGREQGQAPSTSSRLRNGTRRRAEDWSTCATVRRCSRINGVTPTAAHINTTASRFFGTRYVYNVTKAGSPSEQAAPALRRREARVAPATCATTTRRHFISAFGAGPVAARWHGCRSAQQLLPPEPDPALGRKASTTR